MKRRTGLDWAPILFVLLAVVVASTSARVRHRPPGGGTAHVLIEPESNASFSPRTRAYSSSDASGGGYVGIEGWSVNGPDYGRRVAGETAYPFDAPATGTYYCWVRASWSGTCANSITLAVTRRSEGQPGPLPPRYPRLLIGNDTVFDQWHWLRGPELDLEAGPHDAFIGTRESNARIDCVVLTMDERFDPSATPSSSADTSGSGRTAGFVDNFNTGEGRWTFDGSAWSAVRATGVSGIAPLHAGISLAEARTPPPRAGRMEVSIQVPARSAAGLFFGRTAPQDYFVLRLWGGLAEGGAANRLELCHRKGSALDVLASTRLPSRPEAQRELVTVWFGGRHCHVLIDHNPALQADLPRDSEGRVGLFADMRAPSLEPIEVPERLVVRPSRRLRLADFPALADTGRASWHGLTAPLAGGDALVLHWTHLGPGGAYARRAELVRAGRDGSRTILGDRWGTFRPEARTSLSLDWNSGTTVAMVAGAVVGGLRARPVDDVGGLLSMAGPPGLFGDFVLEPLAFRDVAVSVASRGAAGSPPPWGPFETGVVAARLDSNAMPFVWAFDLDGSGATDTLRIDAVPEHELRVRFTHRGTTSIRSFAVGDAVSAAPVVEACFDYGEFTAFVDGRVAASSARNAGTIQGIDALGAAAQAPTAFMQMPANPTLFALGHGWLPEDVHGKQLVGDAMVQVPTSYFDAAARLVGVRLHAARDARGSGYEVELDPHTSAWSLRRNGALIGSGTMPSGDLPDVRLYQFGSLLTYESGSHPIFRYEDSKPLRAGYVGVVGVTVPDSTEEHGILLRQAWDTKCVFHQEINAMSAMALWAPRSGDWSLGENFDHVNGYLLGRNSGSEPAVIDYRGPLDAEELMLEMRLDRSQLHAGDRLSVVTRDSAGQVKDAAVLEWPDPARLRCTLEREQQRAVAEHPMDARNAAPVLGILRTRGDLSLFVDHVRVALMHVPARGRVARIELDVLTPSGGSLAIPSICIQEHPLDAPRSPATRRELLQFLAGAVRGNGRRSL